MKRWFLSMLSGKLGASLLGIMLAGKTVEAKISGQGEIRESEGTIRAVYNF